MNKLKIGLPTGSLQKTTVDLFRKAGIEITVNSRSYYPITSDKEVEVILIKPQEIPMFVEDEVIDLGITGLDWIKETDAKVEKIKEFEYAKRGFNKVKWVLAVPEKSKIRTVKDLEGKTVSTELMNLTKKYFKKNNVKAKAEFSWGATEVKCPVFADAIIDLTETGATLKANNLRVIDIVFESTTTMISNKKALKDKWKKNKINEIKMLLEAALLGMQKVMLEMNVSKEKLDGLIKILPCMKSPTVSELFGEQGYAVKVAVNKDEVPKILPKIIKAGATDVLEFQLNRVVP
ncbi:MAG: ATP phosphoribosyltransferase [Candidatus Diapherotrites archaeon CG10_big_fil_rev_8_21_14_0_10_31_34]|nr:MAG: ATP phosphoribosyltransferase [Candidatus Diapherotrites archaeon CG10_big_fil_rev_8_21_14_0_10_31_34]